MRSSQAAAAPIFDGLPAEVMMEALKSGRLRCFGKGHQIFSPDGLRPQDFLLVLQGQIKLFYLDREGEERDMRFVGPGDLLCPPLEGEPYETPHPAFGESVGSLRLLVLPAVYFLKLLREHFPLTRNLIPQLATSLERANQQTCLCKARSTPVLVSRYLRERLPDHGESINLRPIGVTNADDNWNHVTANGEIISAQIYHYVKPGPGLVARITRIIFSAAVAGVVLISLVRKAATWRKCPTTGTA